LTDRFRKIRFGTTLSAGDYRVCRILIDFHHHAFFEKLAHVLGVFLWFPTVFLFVSHNLSLSNGLLVLLLLKTKTLTPAVSINRKLKLHRTSTAWSFF